MNDERVLWVEALPEGGGWVLVGSAAVGFGLVNDYLGSHTPALPLAGTARQSDPDRA